MALRPVNWACDHVAKVLLILKSLFSTRLLGRSLRYDRPKKFPTIVYGVNLCIEKTINAPPPPFPENAKHSPNAELLLGQRRRRWASIITTLGQCFTRKRQVFTQCWVDVGPTSQMVEQHDNNFGLIYRVFLGPCWHVNIQIESALRENNKREYKFDKWTLKILRKFFTDCLHDRSWSSFS